MTKIDSFAELQTLLRPYSRRLSNNYLLADDIRRLIESGSLFYTEGAGAVFLFERREGYFKLYFQLNELSAQLPPCAEPLVAYLVYRERNQNPGVKDWLEAQGFSLQTEQIHLVADKLNTIPSREGVSLASREEAKELFAACFAPYRADLPLAEHCGEFLAIRGADAVPLGIIHCGSPIIIAVRESAREQKIATRLFSAYAAANRNGSCKLWTDTDNYGAQRLYNKLGFVPDGLKAAWLNKQKDEQDYE